MGVCVCVCVCEHYRTIAKQLPDLFPDSFHVFVSGTRVPTELSSWRIMKTTTPTTWVPIPPACLPASPSSLSDCHFTRLGLTACNSTITSLYPPSVPSPQLQVNTQMNHWCVHEKHWRCYCRGFLLCFHGHRVETFTWPGTFLRWEGSLPRCRHHMNDLTQTWIGWYKGRLHTLWRASTPLT